MFTDKKRSNAIYFTGVVTILLSWLLILPAAAEKELTDGEIRDAVEDQIIFDPVAGLDGIEVSVQYGVVTLAGRVDNILMHDRTEKIAKMVKGVRSVINEIQVIPPAQKTDTEIARDVNRALVMDSATELYELQVDVKENVVFLRGTVPSWQERKIAARVAKGVTGVVKLVNHIDMEYQKDRTDTEIRNEIEKMMRWNVLLDHMLINVDITDGNVILTGTVGSAIEKDEAFNTALVPGVKSVNATGLEVRDWARIQSLRRSKYIIKPDKEIEKAIQDAFLLDPRINSFDITVKSVNGKVRLRGTVNNLKAKRSAAMDARGTVGVYGIQNRIRVKPKASISDAEISENIRQGMRQSPIIKESEITLAVSHGVVDLYGTVESYYEKATADDIAARTSGVMAVDNNIKVTKSDLPYTYDPYLDEWYIYDYDWYHFSPRIPKPQGDSQIQASIENEFFWSPFVDADDIDVEVDKGIVTLTGEVQSWREFYAAQKNAIEGGGMHIKNELEVKPESDDGFWDTILFWR